eukprot:jgi/Mesvir1/6524/Mv25654-RA.1
MPPFAFCVWHQKKNEFAWKTSLQRAFYRHYTQFLQFLPHLPHIRDTISALCAESWARHMSCWLVAAGWQYRNVGHSLKSELPDDKDMHRMKQETGGFRTPIFIHVNAGQLKANLKNRKR